MSRLWLLILTLSTLACESSVKPASDAFLPPADAAPDAQLPRPETHRLIHVAIEAGAHPDGSRDRPFGSLPPAYALAERGDVILLGPGDHGPIEPIPAGVALRGSGVAATQIQGPLALNAGQSMGVLTLQGSVSLGGQAELVDMQIVDTAAPAIMVVGEATLRDVNLYQIGPNPDPLEDRPEAAVVVHEAGALRWDGGGVMGAAVSAIRVDGGQLVAQRLDLSGNHGFGVYQRGGRAELTDLRVFEPWGAGLRFIEAQITAHRITIIDPQLDPTQNTGSGVGLLNSTGQLTEIYTRGGQTAFRLNYGGQITLTDVFCDQPLSNGMNVGPDSTVTVNGFTVVGPPNTGIALIGGHGQLNDVLVRDAGRIGLMVSEHGTVEAQRLTIVGAETERAVTLLNASGVLKDIELTDSLNGCLQITDPSGAVTVEGAVLSGCGTTGASVFGGGWPITLKDLTVEGTREMGEGLAVGVHLYQGAATIIGLNSHHNADAGLQIESGTAVIQDSTLTDNGGPGGVVIGSTEQVRFERVTVERNHGAGILVVQGEALIEGGRIAENTASLEVGPGDGVAGFLQAHLTLKGGYSLDNEGSGVSITQNSRGVITEGIRLEGNGAWGLQVGCDGSTLEAPLDAVFAGNLSGDQSACP